MSTLLIKNARIVLKDNVTDYMQLFIEDGRIKSIGKTEENAVRILDAMGNYLLPGFVDIHVHGGGGADFMDATPEAFETVIKTHLQHGTTTLLPTAMSATESDLMGFINAFKMFRENSEYADIAPGLHLEGPYFSGADAKSSGAQSSSLLRFPDEGEMDRILECADGDILRWDAAPELKGSEMFAEKCKEKGIICSIAHSDATSEEAQKGIDRGFSHVTHFYNAVKTYRKVGQKVLAGVVEAAYLNDNVTIELICDGKHIPRDILRLALKIKSAENVSAITDAMRIAGTDMQKGKLGSMKNGTDVIVDDDVAKLPDMSSFAGSIATMDRCLKVLCVDYGIDIVSASKMLSGAPAKHIKMTTIGEIKVGNYADMVIVNNNYELINVIKNGIIQN